MEKKFEQLGRTAKGVVLDPGEKEKFRSVLSARVGMETRYKESGDAFIGPVRFASVVPFLALMVAGGGITYAAEGALPGDILYPVKMGVNEQVRSFVALSPEAKAAWNGRVLLRRLEEAETLAAKGSLSPTVLAETESSFDAELAQLRRRVADFERSENFHAAADAASTLEGYLAAHERILKSLAGENKESKKEMEKFAEKVAAENQALQAARLNVEARIAKEANAQIERAAEGKMTAVDRKIKEVARFIETKKENIGAEAALEAEAAVARAGEAFLEGKENVEANMHGAAFVLFQKAMRIAEKAKLLVKAQGALNIRLDAGERAGENASSTDSKADQGEKKNGGKDEDLKIETGAVIDVDANYAGKVNGTASTSGEGDIRIDIGL